MAPGSVLAGPPAVHLFPEAAANQLPISEELWAEYVPLLRLTRTTTAIATTTTATAATATRRRWRLGASAAPELERESPSTFVDTVNT
jgi:hypothetical protein